MALSSAHIIDLAAYRAARAERRGQVTAASSPSPQVDMNSGLMWVPVLAVVWTWPVMMAHPPVQCLGDVG